MKHFLLVYDKSAGHIVRCSEYEASERERAFSDRFQVENREILNPNTEVIVLSAESLEDLKATHSRYFPDVLRDRLAAL